jgi:aerobic-type carbon monoxide dehydrogenase small subunit (CoxS/CutS family)
MKQELGLIKNKKQGCKQLPLFGFVENPSIDPSERVEQSATTANTVIQSVTAQRVDGDVARGRALEIAIDGEMVQCFEGETLAAAMLTARGPIARTSSRLGKPRGFYCGIGVCFECAVTVDGRPNVRACQTWVRDGMQVQSQEGLGVWRLR